MIIFTLYIYQIFPSIMWDQKYLCENSSIGNRCIFQKKLFLFQVILTMMIMMYQWKDLLNLNLVADVTDIMVDVNKPDVDKIFSRRKRSPLPEPRRHHRRRSQEITLETTWLLFIDFGFGKKITPKTYFSLSKLNIVTTPYDPFFHWYPFTELNKNLHCNKYFPP